VTDRIEQGLVFGEVAEQYDRARPSYPDALFDTIIEYGGLALGDVALEIGAGTGKATRGFLARGIAVHALEPSPGMAAVLRDHGVDAEETTFEAWDPESRAFRLNRLFAPLQHTVGDQLRAVVGRRFHFPSSHCAAAGRLARLAYGAGGSLGMAGG